MGRALSSAEQAAIAEVIAQGVRCLALDRVYLWAGFVNLMHDQAPTLLSLDLVDLRQATDELRARILSEGTLLHG